MQTTNITTNVNCTHVIDGINININYSFNASAPITIRVDCNKSSEGVYINVNREYSANGTYTPTQSSKPFGEEFDTKLATLMIAVFENYTDPSLVQ